MSFFLSIPSHGSSLLDTDCDTHVLDITATKQVSLYRRFLRVIRQAVLARRPPSACNATWRLVPPPFAAATQSDLRPFEPVSKSAPRGLGLVWCARKVLLIPGKWKRCAVRSVSRRLWSCSRTTMKCQSCRTRTAQLEPSPSPAPSCPCHFLIAHNFFCYRNVIATFRPSKRPDQQYDSHSTGFNLHNHPPRHDIA